MTFTKQEFLLLILAAKGLSTTKIAEKYLHISPNTAKAHRQSINRKLRGTGLTFENLKNLSLEFLLEWYEQQLSRKKHSAPKKLNHEHLQHH